MRVFISHSSGKDTTLIEAVAARLEAAGYQPLLDKHDIQTGDEWRRNINAWLAECHAAVVLFSRRAVEQSQWVLKEATVLTWRRWRDNDFKLVPIRLDDVTTAELDSGPYAPLALEAIQQLSSNDADAIVAEIQRVVGPPRTFRTPLERVQDAIADLIEGVGNRTLEQACADHFGVVDWTQETNRRQRFADLLSRKLLVDGAGCLDTAVKVLHSVRSTLTRSTARRIVELVAPFWVEPDAAGGLKLAAQRKTGFRDVALNAKFPFDFTARMYVQRAYLPDAEGELVPVDEGFADAFVEHVSSCLRAHAAAIQSQKKKPEELDAYINARLKPPFVLLPLLPTELELTELRQRYPDATFISAAGDVLPEPGLLPPGMACLPQLDLFEEDQAFTAYQDAQQFIARLSD